MPFLQGARRLSCREPDGLVEQHVDDLHAQPHGAAGKLSTGLAQRSACVAEAGCWHQGRAQGVGPAAECGAARRAWGQTEVVRAFFDAPAKSRNGLPGRRPVVGNAISLRLDLPPAVIEEWFGK